VRVRMGAAGFLVAVFSILVSLGCERSAERKPPPSVDTPVRTAADSHAVRLVVQQLGERMQRVSLLAPRAQLVASIRSEYAGLVAPTLLEEWVRDPESAPGRLTSSPWPDDIEVDSIARGPSGNFTVTGHVIERTSADLEGGGASNRVPVRLTLAQFEGRWLIVEYRALGL
jgi:hypothetical protein